MKAIINYFKKRGEIKLRKWCVGKAINCHSGMIGNPETIDLAQGLYDWIIKRTPNNR